MKLKIKLITLSSLIVLLGAGCATPPQASNQAPAQTQPANVAADNAQPTQTQPESAQSTTVSPSTTQIQDLVKEMEAYQKTPEYLLQLRDSARIGQLKNIQTSLELYYIDHNYKYPEGNNLIVGSKGVQCLNAKGWQAAGCPNSYFGGDFTGDPTVGHSFVYSSHYDQQKQDWVYTVTAQLEGKSIYGFEGSIVLTNTGIAQR